MSTLTLCSILNPVLQHEGALGRARPKLALTATPANLGHHLAVDMGLEAGDDHLNEGRLLSSRPRKIPSQ
jgi:hypothetical protein